MRYYFLGIGGISMSALAMLLKANGNFVAGCDLSQGAQTARLERKGIVFGEKKKLIADSDIVVRSSAIKDDDEDLLYARALGKKVLSRGQLLAQVAADYQKVIAVSGAHGKTTTTGLIASIFSQAGLDPTVHIGGILQNENSNILIGDKKFFITEACEYKDNFLSLHPDLGIILNVEPEHLDYFGTFEAVKRSFARFEGQCKACFSQKNLCGLTFDDYIEDCDGQKFCILQGGELLLSVKTCLHGEFNAQNVLFATAAALHFGIDKQAIARGIEQFKGVKRRFEKVCIGGRRVIFDYAHHPTEIKKTIAVAKKICEGELVVIFQPHTYSRTRALFDQFLTAFEGADRVIIFQTYPAREAYDEAGDGKTLAKALGCSFSCDYELIYSFGQEQTLLVLGAGDLYDFYC